MGSSYRTLSGTSMATPFVTGAIALFLSTSPNLSYVQIKDRLIQTGEKLKGYRNKVVSASRLNVYNFLTGTIPADQSQIPASQWTTQSSTVESGHPYASNTTQRWTISQSGATYFTLHFDRLSLVGPSDVIRVTDGSGAQVLVLNNKAATALSTSEIKGPKVTIEMTTGPASADFPYGYGFSIDQYSWTKSQLP